jgi:hypothetical protein
VERRAGAHNNALFKRQEVLAAAWADYGKSKPPRMTRPSRRLDEGARRGAAKANMPNGFRLAARNLPRRRRRHWGK